MGLNRAVLVFDIEFWSIANLNHAWNRPKSKSDFSQLASVEPMLRILTVSPLHLQILQKFFDGQAGLLQNGLQSLWLD